jgi:hypothetical protein
LESIGIKRVWHKNENKIQFRQLNGVEKLKVFSRIDLVSLFPNLENVTNIQYLWRNLYVIISKLRSGCFEDKLKFAEEIKLSTSRWLDIFIKTYHEAHITPYIHVLVEHVHEMVAVHGDISLFIMEGDILFFSNFQGLSA